MIAALSASVVWLLAQDATPPLSTFQLDTGATLRGQVLAVDGDKVTLKIHLYGGTAETQRKLDDFTPRSACDIQSAVAKPDSFEDHFKIAQFAAANRVIDVAGKEAGIARQIVEKDPARSAELTKLASWAADTLEMLFREALKKNDLASAKRFLQILMTRVPNTRTEEQKNALLDELAQGEEQVQKRREARDKSQQDAAKEKESERQLAPIRKDLEEGKKLSRDAMLQASSQGKALSLLESAIDRYRAAWKAAEKIQQSASSDAALRNSTGQLAEQILDNGIAAGLSAAHILTTRSDYQGALAYVNKILAIDPENSDAKELRKTIELAAGGGWGWGWGWGGSTGGPTPARSPAR